MKNIRFYKLSEDSDSLSEQMNINLCNKEFLNILCDCHCFLLYLYVLCARKIGTVLLNLTHGDYYLRDVMLCSVADSNIWERLLLSSLVSAYTTPILYICNVSHL